MIIGILALAGCTQPAGSIRLDYTRPLVLSTVPLASATGVSISAAISATFSEALDPATVTAATFDLVQGGTAVAASVVYSGTMATLTPSAGLAFNTVYTATVTTGVKDLAGNALEASQVWSFTTGTAPVVTPPTVGTTNVAVTAVSLGPTTLNLLLGGATGSLTATFVPANATDKNVTWSSGTPTVATVDILGVVSPVAVGTSTVTVTTADGGKTATCLVTVGTTNVPVTGVSVSPATMNLFVGGATGSLTATVAPANATNINVTWASSNASVATVSAGVVSPVSIGSATITVTTADGGHFATCAVTVSPMPVTGVGLSPTSMHLILGGVTGTLTATIAPANATNTGVTWASGNIGVATVNGSGVVTAVSIGNATITVTTNDGGHTATCGVNVSIPIVNLGTAGNYAVLAKSGIDIPSLGGVTGDIGVSPIAAAAITGFAPVMDGTGAFSTANPPINGRIYASNYSGTTPGNLTAAVTAMQSAYANALGRTSPVGVDVGTAGATLSPGLYTWTTAISISTNLTLTLNGGPDDVWIFQVNGALTLGVSASVVVTGGALSKNIFWQITGASTFDANSHFEGVVLGSGAIIVETGATLNGRLLSQTAVTINGTGSVTQPLP